jgi:hypothetical protein
MHIRRREFIVTLGGAAAWPVAARAQRSKMPIVGYLDGSGLPRWFEAFKRGLNDLGYVHGRTVAIEVRDAAGQAELLPKLARSGAPSGLRPSSFVMSDTPVEVQFNLSRVSQLSVPHPTTCRRPILPTRRIP